MLDNAGEWLSDWFSEINSWHPTAITRERFSWVRCFGIPTHAWCEDFFRRMVFSFGVYCYIDQPTLMRTRLDVARFLIRTSALDLINFVGSIKINDDYFSVRVIEELLGDFSHSSHNANSGISSSSDETKSDSFSKGVAFEDFLNSSDDEVMGGHRKEDASAIQMKVKPPEMGSGSAAKGKAVEIKSRIYFTQCPFRTSISIQSLVHF
jgi:hypothetical protein